VLLAGSIQPKALSGNTGRSPVCLPLGEGTTLLAQWILEASALARQQAIEQLALRILAGDRTSAPPILVQDSAIELAVEQDPAEFRGTGGVLRDLAGAYADSAYLVVAAAGQLLTGSLEEEVDALVRTNADVALFAELNGLPSGVMLIRCGCLRCLSEIGFVDLKEQGLATIAKHHRVAVVRRRQPVALPVRTRSEYIHALRWYHQVPRPGPRCDPFAETWQSVFSICEPGARVASGATLHDSVVLEGGIVESGATVVRSVVCRGGVVRRNRRVVDEVVVPSDRRA
jgi:hypothetical protein